jgi:serpin B
MRMRKHLLLLGLAVAVAGGCTKNRPDELTKVDPVHAKAVVAGNNQFTFDLYHELRDPDGNLFFSPYSITSALGMTYAGARTQTAEEMARALHFTLPQERLHAALGSLRRRLQVNGKDAGYQLNIANALWGQQNYGFLPDFLNQTKTHYGAGLHEIDFSHAEVARMTINAWVDLHTASKIKELLRPGSIDQGTRLILTNAIYFKGDWASKFTKENTQLQPFIVVAGQTVEVPLMMHQGEYAYVENGNLQMLELPYVGKALSMMVLLPKAPNDLAALEKSLTVEVLEKEIGRLQKSRVQVFLPRFKLTSQFQLLDALQKLGMRRAFGDADFSGMVGSEKVSLSEVIHEAFVEVNEEGTEAAAATAVKNTGRSAMPNFVFRADKPFLFLIRENGSGTILFLGRVADPRAF